MRTINLLLVAISAAGAGAQTLISTDSNLEQFPTIVDPSAPGIPTSLSISITRPFPTGTSTRPIGSSTSETGTSTHPIGSSTSDTSSTLSLPTGVIPDPSLSDGPGPTDLPGAGSRVRAPLTGVVLGAAALLVALV